MIPFLAAVGICLAGWLIYRIWRFAGAVWVPVLCYHHVAEPDGTDTGGLYISPQMFNDQLGYLRKTGYSPVTLGQLFDHVDGGVELPEKPVAVTFDDGYLDNWTYAFPLLCHFDVPATIFIITSRVGEGDLRPTLDDVREGTVSREELDQGYLNAVARGESWVNWSELSRMRATGLISLGGHSHTHVDLSRADRQTALDELRTCRGILQEMAGGECLDLAWPFGFHSLGAERTARMAGFRSAFRISTRLFGGRGNRPGSNPLSLRRLAVTPDLDLEKALEFYHEPSLVTVLRSAVDFTAYHLGKRFGRK